jgi:toxin ParE1/3/4
MRGYILSPAAQRDLNDIWDYTAEHWSPAQANRYVETIRDTCQRLGAGHRRGRQIDDVRPGYWKLAVKSHSLVLS